MNINLFMFFYNRYKMYDSLLNNSIGGASEHKKAYYAIMGGFARAGVYLCS